MNLKEAIEVAKSRGENRQNMLIARVRIAERIEELERKIAEAKDELLARKQSLRRLSNDLGRWKERG